MRTLPIVLVAAFLACCDSGGPSSSDQQALTKEQAQQLSLHGDRRGDAVLEPYYFQCVECGLDEKKVWFEIIAKHGNDGAMVNLAEVLTRQGGEANCASAERWLIVAINQGTPDARTIANDWLERLRAGHMGLCKPRA